VRAATPARGPLRPVRSGNPTKPSKPVRSARVPKPEPVRPAVRERVPQGKNREPLKAQRVRARKRMRVIMFLLLLAIMAGLYSSLWLSLLRVQHVDAAGPHAQEAQAIASHDLEGMLWYIVPRNSIFFAPTSQIRSDIEKAYPDISAVSIHRTSFSTIALSNVGRIAAFTWCGASPDSVVFAPAAMENSSQTASSSDSVASSTDAVATPTQSIEPQCYAVDSQGFIFAETGSEPVDHSVLLYGAIANASSTPIGNTVLHAASIPNALQFVKALGDLDVTVQKLVIRGDEADLYTPEDTRITYVLGKEQQAIDLADAGFPSLNVSDGSLDYVDLRFADKVYYMRKGAAVPQSASSTSAQ